MWRHFKESEFMLQTGACAGRGLVRAREYWSAWRCAMFDLLFPPSCPCCQHELLESTTSSGFCDDCLTRLFPDRGRTCRRCDAPVPELVSNDDCYECRDSQFHFEQVRGLGVYRNPLSIAVLQMKKFSGQAIALTAGRLLAHRFAPAERANDFDLVVPIPTHWTRRIWQGVNAPDLLAEAFSSSTHLPCVYNLLYTRRRRERQTKMTPQARWSNVRGVYGVSSAYDIKEARIALIDDVLTTGATASQAAWVLRQAGAASVSVFVVARGIGANGSR